MITGWCSTGNHQCLDGVFEHTALLHAFPLLNHRFLMEQLNGGRAVDASLLGNGLIGFDVDDHRLGSSVELRDHTLQLGLQHMAGAAGG